MILLDGTVVIVKYSLVSINNVNSKTNSKSYNVYQ